MPLFRARLIGLGFDPERELVLIELRERSSDETRTTRTRRSSTADDEDDDEGYVARIYATRAAGAGDGGARRGSRRRRPAAVPAVRACRWTPPGTGVPAGTDARRARATRSRRAELEVVGRMRVLVERDVPRRGDASTAWSCRRSTSPGAASGRCGTSPQGTLCQREVAAYELSAALGWDIVPVTILRDGPLGVGAVQRFVDHDPDEHYFTLLDEHEDRFRQFAVFDVLVNNTDRKGGHCLARPGERR